MFDFMCLVIVLNIFAFMPLGGRIGRARGNHKMGQVLGLFFGPLGVIMVGLSDDRPMCRTCYTRLNGPATICPACHAAMPLDHSAKRKVTEALTAPPRAQR